jgi:hypothetical protein
MKPSKPEDVFRAEKERSLTVRNSQHAKLLAEAKAAFDKLMAEGQAARKSGRPRKHPLPPLKTTPSTRPPMIAAAPVPAPASIAAVAPAKAPGKTFALAPVKAASRSVVKRPQPAKKVVKRATKAKAKTKRSTKR